MRPGLRPFIRVAAEPIARTSGDAAAPGGHTFQ
jgi:hypothetical protein